MKFFSGVFLSGGTLDLKSPFGLKGISKKVFFWGEGKCGTRVKVF